MTAEQNGVIIQDGYWWDGTAWQPMPTVAQPNVEMNVFTTTERMSMIIHGASKIGKSTLAGSAPKPILVFDAEGSWRFVGDPARVRVWDPIREALPVHDGTWDICLVPVAEWATMESAYRYLRQYQTPFVTVVVDSITEIQRRLKENLKGTAAMQMQDWGVLLVKMDGVIRGIRDLTLVPNNLIRCVVFVAETRLDKAGRFAPTMQGQIADSLPYWVDLVGYMYAAADLDANGQATQEVRKLWIGPSERYVTGSRVQHRLGHELTVYPPADSRTGDDIERWMMRVFRSREGSTTR